MHFKAEMNEMYGNESLKFGFRVIQQCKQSKQMDHLIQGRIQDLARGGGANPEFLNIFRSPPFLDHFLKI